MRISLTFSQRRSERRGILNKSGSSPTYPLSTFAFISNCSPTWSGERSNSTLSLDGNGGYYSFPIEASFPLYSRSLRHPLRERERKKKKRNLNSRLYWISSRVLFFLSFSAFELAAYLFENPFKTCAGAIIIGAHSLRFGTKERKKYFFSRLIYDNFTAEKSIKNFSLVGW